MRNKICFIVSIIFILFGLTMFMIEAYDDVSKSNQISKVDFEDNKTKIEQSVKAKQSTKTDKSKNVKSSDDKKSDGVSIYDDLYSDIKAYNKKLVDNQYNMLVSEDVMTYPFIDLTKYDIYNNCIGQIRIPSIDCDLPVYLGASEANMSYGATHVNCTSAPIGGKNTNTVICAHTGYEGVPLFDNLPYVSYGDNIYLDNYWQTLKYKVIEIKEVIPTESSILYVQKGKDLLTLFTCIPDGQGDFNRFVVVAERVRG